MAEDLVYESKMGSVQVTACFQVYSYVSYPHENSCTSLCVRFFSILGLPLGATTNATLRGVVGKIGVITLTWLNGRRSQFIPFKTSHKARAFKIATYPSSILHTADERQSGNIQIEG